VFAAIQALLEKNNWLGQWGFIQSRTDYLNLLANADGVLSTALHDFQGLSVLEAYASGCLPLVPDRLAYQEFIPAQYRYPSFIDDEEREAKAAADCIANWVQGDQASNSLLDSPKDLGWQQLRKVYCDLFESKFGA
jgi:glycosyltransferase involved in cell wall biosynthesis